MYSLSYRSNGSNLSDKWLRCCHGFLLNRKQHVNDHPIIIYIHVQFEWVSEWWSLNANSAIFQLHHGENKLIFNEMMMRFALYKINTLSCIFIVLAHWNNSPQIDISTHSDTLSWFRVNQLSLLFLLNVVCLVEMQQCGSHFGFKIHTKISIL